MKEVSLPVGSDAKLEVANILNGTFAPLAGFMTGENYRSVVDDMHLSAGAGAEANSRPWTIPVTLEVSADDVAAVKAAEFVRLSDETGKALARMRVEDVFKVDYGRDLKKVFKVDSADHPGVCKESARSPYRVGGRLERIESEQVDHAAGDTGDDFPYFSPAQSRAYFAKQGWRTITGFQTRNPLHRAHEYLHRVAMEVSDGLFIQPLLGWKKAGDFTAEAVFAGYRKMTDDFYPHDRVLLGSLRTPMRYAGPREAVFHALIRRNHGCTHFIIGRDHAGVGGFYGKYEAQELALSFRDLGIEIRPLCGPFHCNTCGGIVTEKTCGHSGDAVEEVSGTLMRAAFTAGRLPPEKFMRREVSEVLLRLQEKGNLIYGET